MCGVHLCIIPHKNKTYSCFQKWHKVKDLHSLTKVTAVTPKSKPQAKQKPKLIGKKPTKKAEAKEGSVVNKRGVRRSARNQVEGNHGEEV